MYQIMTTTNTTGTYLEYDAISNNECTFLFYKKLRGITNDLDLFYERLVDENLGNVLTIQRRWRKPEKSKLEMDTIIYLISALIFKCDNTDLISSNMIIFLYTEYVLCESEISIMILARLYSVFASMAYSYYDAVTLCEPDFPGSKYYLFDRWMYYQLLPYFRKYIEWYLGSNYMKVDTLWEEWDDLEETYVSYAEWLPREMIEDVAAMVRPDDIVLVLSEKLPDPESYTDHRSLQPNEYSRRTMVPNETRPGWVTLRRPNKARSGKK